MLYCYELSTGRRIWEKSLHRSVEGSDLSTNHERTLLVIPRTEDEQSAIVNLRTGVTVGHSTLDPFMLAPRWMELFATEARLGGERQHAIALRRWSDQHALVTIPVQVGASASRGQFDPSGRLLAWGNPDGSVVVCDLNEIRERLVKVGMSWRSD